MKLGASACRVIRLPLDQSYTVGRAGFLPARSTSVRRPVRAHDADNDHRLGGKTRPPHRIPLASGYNFSICSFAYPAPDPPGASSR